ncbi:hypothetical protein DPMN_158339 [Dreissena polymorpha]|uniref:Uncharacterized protein n=1 Tax=Dreissena polymorpha TaxID=45954 RepID=A0A9D4EJM7_DREPO|nr:hypothetical protein DPMN_158339 [Dreissena polymorpha]
MSQQQLMQLLGGMGGPGGGLSALMGRPGSAQSTASEPCVVLVFSQPRLNLELFQCSVKHV